MSSAFGLGGPASPHDHCGANFESILQRRDIQSPAVIEIVFDTIKCSYYVLIFSVSDFQIQVISNELVPSLKLANDEITLGSAVPLARRFAKDGFWQVDRLDREPMAALLSYSCDLHGLDPAACAEVVHRAAGLIGRTTKRSEPP